MQGFDANIYHSTTTLSAVNTPATVSWTEGQEVKDVSLDLSRSEHDKTTRANGGMKAYAAGLLDSGINIEMPWLPGNSFFDALKTAFLNNTTVSIAVMDGPIATSGKQGLAANFVVTAFPQTQPIDGESVVSCTVKPYSQIQWYTAA